MQGGKSTKRDGNKSSREQWLKIQAMQVIAILPDNAGEMRRVLAYAVEVVDTFIDNKEAEPAQLTRLLSLVRKD